MRELIGERGELLLIKTNRDKLGIDLVLLGKIEDAASTGPNNGPADRAAPWL